VPAATGRSVDYLYIDANEGGSSGGHTALRLGDVVYHYQFERPGVLHLEGEPSDDFDARYRVLENRTIRLSRVPVDDETFDLLVEEFRRRGVAQETLRACRASLAADARLLEAIRAARHGGSAGVPVAAAGFFSATIPAPPSEVEETALRRLRARVAEAYGTEFLDRRVEDLRRGIAALPVGDAWEPGAPAIDDAVACRAPWSRWEDDAAGLAALMALRDARALVPDAVVATGAALEREERPRVEELARALDERLLELVRASHPGWGFALAVVLARRAALERTLAAGEWQLLDAYPPDAKRLDPAAVAYRRDALAELADVARTDFAAARREVVAGSLSELALGGVEATGNRMAELARALRGGSLRLFGGALLPVRPATWLRPESVASAAVLDAAIGEARARERRFGRAVESLHAYDLIRRNCVTELFRTMESAVARATPPGVSPDDELARRLGGRVSVEGSLAFIPFVSAAAVESHLAVSQTAELPSYRLDRVSGLEAEHGRLRTWLREGNTLTSTIYRRNPDDSFFVFFTDDTVALRPVLGAANLVAAAGASVAGLVTIPLDHGARLRAGLRGALFSLPELAFVNIRKGSFTHAPAMPEAR
jgi:hypothetical protein